MADDKRRLSGPENSGPRFWIMICRIWCFISVLIMILVIVAESIILNNSMQRYHDIYGNSYPSRGYDRDPSGPQSGYVALTNVPKHVGSLVFSSAFQVSLILFAAFVGLGDLALVYKSPDNGAYRGMQTFKGTHLSAPLRYEDTYKPRQSIREPFFIVGLSLLKLFIGCAYMSQSFYGISTGDNDNNGANNVYYRSLTERCEGVNCNSGGSGYYYGGDSSGSAGYSYSYGHDGNNNGGGNQGTDVQLFCLWAGFILLGSVPLTFGFQAFSYQAQMNDKRWAETA
ncbi:hypothetical protein HD553DRAFT_363160 [Filobasidium floriforme]|uniref:uncharacterized protein n=1 Tax=Filobasidium floriforme TaxID=5210 RepID=UPI001E8E2AFF|nr:uncharacterized protein HD553DRAFT_363160 [Filobasidium floriforme]KAH8079269.1 hypothetical protein HD553DRAFT_363160 [Filobasidium floriforme]